MNRIFVMTFGLFFVLFSAQLFLIKAYVLTPQATRFVTERFEAPDVVNNMAPNHSGPFNQASFRMNSSQPSYLQTANYLSNSSVSQRSIAPPNWLCWPTFFFGMVVFLHGLALRNK